MIASHSALIISMLKKSSSPQQTLQKCILVVTGVLLLALAGRLEIMLPFSPVPITGQTLGVFLIALTYGQKLGLSTIGAYILVGTLGMPVFAGGAGSIAALLSPSGGYIMGYFIATALCGYLADRGWTESFLKLVAALLCGHILMYLCGLAQLSFFLPDHLLTAGLYPFIAGDIFKSLMVVISLPVSWKLIKRQTQQKNVSGQEI